MDIRELEMHCPVCDKIMPMTSEYGKPDEHQRVTWTCLTDKMHETVEYDPGLIE